MIYLKSSVGIEIHNEDLVLSCLRSNLSGSVLTGHTRISNYRTRDQEEVRQEIARFFKGQRVNRDNVVLGIPRRDVILRYLDLPREVEDNLKQVMAYQVQSFEPSESERSYYDYVALKPGAKDKRLKILLAMVRKSVLDAHLAVMSSFGIRPIHVTAGSAALANLLLGMLNGSAGRTYVLANLDRDRVETMLLRDGALAYSHEVPKPEGLPWIALLRQQIEVAAGRARLGPEDTIDGIVLGGEASEAVQREVREEIPESRLIGDLMRFEMAVEQRAHLQEASSSVGLAFSGMVRRPPVKLNLLPPELRIRQAHWAYIPTVIFGLAVLALLIAAGARQVVQEQILARELDQQIRTLQPQVDRVQQVRAEADSLAKRIAFTEDLLRRRDMNLEILQELTNILPPDTYLSIYRNQDCLITISGLSSSAPDLIATIERSPLLANVVQRSTIFKDAQTGKDRFQFEAKCER